MAARRIQDIKKINNRVLIYFLILIIGLNGCKGQQAKSKWFTEYYLVDYLGHQNKESLIKVDTSTVYKNEVYGIFILDSEKITTYNITGSKGKIEFKKLKENIYINNQTNAKLIVVKKDNKQLVLQSSMTDSIRYEFYLKKHPKKITDTLSNSYLVSNYWKLFNKSKKFNAKYIKFNTKNTATLYFNNNKSINIKWENRYISGVNYLTFFFEDNKFLILINQIDKDKFSGKLWNKGKLLNFKFKKKLNMPRKSFTW